MPSLIRIDVDIDKEIYNNFLKKKKIMLIDFRKYCKRVLEYDMLKEIKYEEGKNGTNKKVYF
jgi:hypothetical protein